MVAARARCFERQIDCLKKDDREAHLQRYSEDCVFEFAFAPDRPRRLAGRDEIRRVMTPLWEEARRLGVRVTKCDAIVHLTADPQVIVTAFTLSIDVRGSVARMAFVQVLRVRDNRIAQVREYFSPMGRGEVLDR